MKSRTTATGLRIAMCGNCSIPLPLSKSLTSFEAKIWVCHGCDREIKGQLATDYTIAVERQPGTDLQPKQ